MRHFSLALLLSLTACQTCSPVTERMICPAINAYTQEQRQQLAEEIDHLSAGSMLGVVAIEWRDLRAKLRACQGS